MIRSFTCAMLAGWLGEDLVRMRKGSGEPDCSGGIRLPEEADPLAGGFLYVGEAETLRACISRRTSADPVCIVCSGRFPEDPRPEFFSPVWILETELPLISLYNRVQQAVRRFEDWDRRMSEAVCANAELQKILEIAAEQIDASILVLNAGYRLLAHVHGEGIEDLIEQDILKSGFQTYEVTQRLYDQHHLGDERKDCFEFVSDEGNNYTVARRIRYRGTLYARILVIRKGPELSRALYDLSGLLAAHISDSMFSGGSVDYRNDAAFGALAADLIELRLTDREELEERLKQITLAVERYYHVIVVQVKEDKNGVIPWNLIINQLERVFPCSNITTYKGRILLVVKKRNRGMKPKFDEELLEQILLRYNGKAVIGNFSEFLTSLPVVYNQAAAALRIGETMDPERLIYYYEEYSTYQMIELAGRAARVHMGSCNLVHLCHPGLISMMLYDNKNGTNLTQILYVYLQKERNAAETAKVFYMHRNTMLNKVRRIEEILGMELEDPALRERLLYSYHVLEYMQKYRKEDLLYLRSNKAAAEDEPRE